MKQHHVGLAICLLISGLVACSSKANSSSNDAADSGSTTAHDSSLTTVADAHDSATTTVTDAHDSGATTVRDTKTDSATADGAATDSVASADSTNSDASADQITAAEDASQAIYEAENNSVEATSDADAGLTDSYTLSTDGTTLYFTYNGYLDVGSGFTLTGTDVQTNYASTADNQSQVANVTFTGGLVTSVVINVATTDNWTTCTGSSVYNFTGGTNITCDCSNLSCP